MSVAALTIRNNGAVPRVYSYANATPTALGDAFPTGAPGSNFRLWGGNRVIVAGGEIWAVAHDGVYRKDNPNVATGAWSQVLAFTSPSSAKTGGIYLLDNGGVPTLYTWFGTTTANQYRTCACPLDSRPYTWTERGAFTTANPDLERNQEEALLGTTVFAVARRDGSPTRCTVLQINLIGNSGSASNRDGLISDITLGSTTSLAVVNGRLLAVFGTSTISVWEWTGSSFVSRVGLISGGFEYYQFGFLWESGDDFFVFGHDTSGNRYQCWKITLDVWTPTNISATVLPAPLLSGIGAHSGCRVVVDRTVNLASTEYQVHFVTGLSGLNPSFSAYTWNGESSLMTLADSGGNYHDSMPESLDLIGGRHHIPGELDIDVKSSAPTFGGMDFTVVAHGDPVVISHGGVTGTLVEGETLTGAVTGTTAVLIREADSNTLHVGGVSGPGFDGSEQINGAGGSVTMNAAATGGAADKIVKLRYIDPTTGDLAQGTLTGSVTGGTAVRVGNQVENIVADGVTVYTFIWDFFTDGITPGDSIRLTATVGV